VRWNFVLNLAHLIERNGKEGGRKKGVFQITSFLPTFFSSFLPTYLPTYLLGFELRASSLLGRCSYHGIIPPVLFWDRFFFEIRYLKLFAWG
jgi:hypothetical protein